MKAFLLAAGLGTRLKPYTLTQPKCLIPIHGRPLLGIWLDLLCRSGVDEVLINTHHHADQVNDFVKTVQARLPMRISTVYEPQLLGSAGTLQQNADFAANEKNFIIAYADNLTDLNLRKMIDFHENIRSMGGIFTMGLFHAPDPWRRGIAALDRENRIIGFEEKPKAPQSNLANAGVYVADGEIFSYLGEMTSQNDGVLDIAMDLIPRLMGKMFGIVVEGYLQDIGTPETYRQALAEWPISPEAGKKA